MRILSLSLALSFLVGCNSNPYPDGLLSDKPERDLRPIVVAPGIDVPATLEFQEGATSEFKINVSVPKGSPKVTLTGLPSGASYDPATFKLTWTPSYTDANDPNNPAIKTRSYDLLINLMSDVDNTTQTNKTIKLVVSDVARAFTLSSIPDSVNVSEGQEKVLTRFKISSEDFANGPFSVSLKNGSPGLRLTYDNAKKEWVLKAGAFGYDAVKVSQACSYFSCTMLMKESIVVYAPDGRRIEKNIDIELKDKRQGVVVSLANETETQGETYLGLNVMDPNQEVVPLVTIDQAPGVGKFEIKQLPTSSGSDFEGQFFLSWSQVPQEANGKTYTFRLKACNSSEGSELNYDACKTLNYKFKVQSREVAKPNIARQGWDASELKYLLVNKKFSQRVDVTPGAGSRILSVDATSSDAGDDVSYASNTLSIIPKKPGIKVAMLSAMNSVGGAAAASFMYEALPTQWSSNLVLGLVGNVPELSAIEARLPNFNREFNGVDGRSARSLSYRDLLVVGGHTLGLHEAEEEISFYAKNLKNILVSTPALERLPQSVIDELYSHGVRLSGRASNIPGFDLKEYELLSAEALGLPTRPAALGGSLTNESLDPGLLTVTMNSKCTKLFTLLKNTPPSTEVVLGTSCKRKNGGKIVVLGFEWGDIKVAKEDEKLPEQWFKKMMEQ